jgi:hypothetical protein
MNARRLVIMGLLVLPLAMLGTRGALGQDAAPSGTSIQSQVLKVTFPFQVGDMGKKTLPAGEYDIEQPTRELLVLRSAKGAVVQLPVLMRLAQPSPPLSEPKVVFDRLGGQYYISEVWIPGWDGFLVGGLREEHTHYAVTLARKK